MAIKKEDLDKRICDTEQGAENTQTWRDYIREGEKEFEMKNVDLDNMEDKQLNEHLDFIDYLGEK